MKNFKKPTLAIFISASMMLIAACTGQSSTPTSTTVDLPTLKKAYEEERILSVTKLKNWRPNSVANSGKGFPSREELSAILVSEKFNGNLREAEDFLGVQTSRQICKGTSYGKLLAETNPSSANVGTWANEAMTGGAGAQDKESYPLFNVSTILFGVNEDLSKGLFSQVQNAVYTFGEQCKVELLQGIDGKCGSWSSSIDGWLQEEDLIRNGCRLGKNRSKVRTGIGTLDIPGFENSFYIAQMSERPKAFIRSVMILPIPALGIVLLNELFVAKNDQTLSFSEWESELNSLATKSARISRSIIDTWIERFKLDLNYDKIARLYGELKLSQAVSP